MRFLHLIISLSVLCSCNRATDCMIIGADEADNIKDVLTREIDEYELTDFERCYFKKYVNELTLDGEFYDVIHEGVLIKYMLFEDLGFYYSIVKHNDDIYFVGYQNILKATRHYNEVVRNQTFSFDWSFYNHLNSAEIRSLNSILSDLSFNSNREIGSLINKLYSTEVPKIPSTYRNVFEYLVDPKSIQEWLEVYFSLEAERNAQMMKELETAEVYNYLSNSFILSSSIYGLHHFSIVESEKSKEVSCRVLFSNYPHDNYISGNDVTIVKPGDCNRINN